MIDNVQAMRIIISLMLIAFNTACAIIATQDIAAPANGAFTPAMWLLADALLHIVWNLVMIWYVMQGLFRVIYFTIFVGFAAECLSVVVGSIIFWANNPTGQPKTLAGMCTAALVLKFVSIGVTALCHRDMVDK